MRKQILIILAILLIALSVPVYAGGARAGTGYHICRSHHQALGGKSNRAHRGLRRAAEKSKVVKEDASGNGDFETVPGETVK
jgi:hypothetical protein